MAEHKVWVAQLVANAVRQIVGASVADEAPLLSAGLDSLGELSAHFQLMFP